MDNIILLLLCLLAGLLLRYFRRVPDTTHVGLNAFIINLSLPALILNLIHQVQPEPRLAFAILMPWLVFVVGAAVFALAGRVFRLPRPSTGALIVTGGLGNTSFIGVPMIETFYGNADVPIGIIIDQLGTYLVLSTIGLLTICMYAEGSVTGREIVRRVITFPPLIALVLAICLFPVAYPSWLVTVLTRLGNTLVPLALVSVGLQLRVEAFRGKRDLLVAGLGYKLLAAPLLVALLYFGAFGGSRVRGGHGAADRRRHRCDAVWP